LGDDRDTLDGVADDDVDIWHRILDHLRREVEPEEFRRWFSDTTFASDSGDLLTIWIPTEANRRVIASQFGLRIDQLLSAFRPHTSIRFVVTGTEEDDD
jgi:chromosomal replication initiation ATPase DnaA